MATIAVFGVNVGYSIARAVFQIRVRVAITAIFVVH